MRYIDLETYPRRGLFAYFGSLAYPYVGMSANVDVTGLLKAAKERGGTSFLACLWAAARAANSVPELRQRIVDGKIAEFDYCRVAHTLALPDETFCSCHTDTQLPFDEFLVAGRAAQLATKENPQFVSSDDETELMFVSCVPWVAFTQVIQPAPIPADSNPRIVFGKYIQEGDKTRMPLAIQANHALVDGRHIGKFYQAFEEINASFL